MARAFVRDTLGVALSQYVSRVALLARGLAAAVALGPAGFGAWNALNLILDYGAYASAGAFQGLDLELPGHAARGDVSGAARAMRGAWAAALAGGVLFAAGVVVMLAQGTWVAVSGWGWGAPLLMIAAAFVQLALLYHASALRAQGAFGPVSAGVTAQALVGGGLGLALVWVAGVWGLIGGWLAGGLIGLLWMRRSPSRPPLAPGRLERGLALARAGLPVFAFFAWLVVLRSLDRIALVRFGGNDALGLYSLGLIAAGLVLYVPEGAAAVLLPRVAAAASGDRDRERTRREVVRAQRALTVLLPLAVGVGALWVAPIVARLLPAFAEGAGATVALALGALLLSTATLPAYFLLGSGEGGSLNRFAALATAITGVLVFVTAARDPRPASVAWAAAAGYGVVALPVLALAVSRLADAGGRVGLMVASLAPTLAAAGLVLGLPGGRDPAIAAAVRRTLYFLLAYAPVLLLFGRGLGLRQGLLPRARPA